MPYGIELLKAGGAQASGNAINEGTGLLLAGPKRKAQMRTAKQMQNLQIEGQKHMSDFNFKKQLELWEKTGYGAQVDQMKRAGINPALLYGMGSGGGQTASIQGGNVSGQSAQEPHSPRGSEGMGLMIGQMGLIEAQRKNIEADTRLKEVDANKREGVDTLEAEERITNLSLTNEFLKRSMEDRIDQINTDAAKAIAELDIKEGMRDEERMTRMSRVQKIRADAAGAILNNLLIEANTRGANQSIEESKQRVLTMKADINKMAEQIAQGWQGLDIQQKELDLRKWVEGIKAKYPGLWNVAGRMLNDAAAGLGRLFGEKQDAQQGPPKK